MIFTLEAIMEHEVLVQSAIVVVKCVVTSIQDWYSCLRLEGWQYHV